MANRGWYGVDLDGTLFTFDHWRGVDHVGEPIWPMINRVKQWLSEGKEVRIFTARCAGPEDCKPAIEAACLKYIGQVLPITNIKDFGLIELWDDRAVQVIYNTGERVG
ncbi:hypothetical protein U8P73_36460 (plasmid) [Rhizobium beringeri]|uniref:hypothetical protein n=1 Tax=Rhizobium beringeri TaxID=3019934 RepID=UPI002DDD01BC|nr:hypothetical protein [Rhizobium beringeri]WSG93466.1 hypothetical protein U8P73_36460 [Rhizobium beringeri]